MALFAGMKFERIVVFTRDEYRDAEEPYGFEWRNDRFDIACILDRWYEGYLDARRMPLRYFKVKTTGGEQYIIRYHELFRAWSILAPHQIVEGDSETDD